MWTNKPYGLDERQWCTYKREDQALIENLTARRRWGFIIKTLAGCLTRICKEMEGNSSCLQRMHVFLENLDAYVSCLDLLFFTRKNVAWFQLGPKLKILLGWRLDYFKWVKTHAEWWGWRLGGGNVIEPLMLAGGWATLDAARWWPNKDSLNDEDLDLVLGSKTWTTKPIQGKVGWPRKLENHTKIVMAQTYKVQ